MLDIEIWDLVYGNNLKFKLVCFEWEKGYIIFFLKIFNVRVVYYIY